nr:MAG TPA: hypothetical protein [Caudoviricetes sp.]
MWQFIVSHLADIFMVLCGIFAGAAIIVLEVAIGTVIEKDILSRLLYTFFVLALDSFLLAILTIR